MPTNVNTETTLSGLQVYEDRLLLLKEQNLDRSRQAFESPDGITLLGENNRLINFCGNNYLGFSHHPKMIEASQLALQQYGVALTSSQLINGYTPLQQQLEQSLCQWLNAPSAIVYNSGYQANIGLLGALIDSKTSVYMDKLCHASLYDGLMSVGCIISRYKHFDLDALEKMLAEDVNPQKFIVTESVFSMDGDVSDLEKLLSLAQKYQTFLVVDEAHAVGVFGDKNHSGCVENLNLKTWPDCLIVMGTFSKALGGFGAFVAAHQTIGCYLINKSRALIYTTALPPSVLASNLQALMLLQAEPQWSKQLWLNLEQFQNLLGKHLSVTSPICPWILGSEQAAIEHSQKLLQQGLLVKAIRPPTVPNGTSRLRITLSALHTPEHLKQLASSLLAG